MSGKSSVMLARSAGGPFRRTLRDKDGQPLKDDAGNPRVLIFQPGQPLELTTEELEAVRDDIGTALHFAKVDKEDKPLAKPDDEATAKFVAERNKRREAERKAAEEEKREFNAQREIAARDALAAAARAPLPARKAVAHAEPHTTGRAHESKDR